MKRLMTMVWGVVLIAAVGDATGQSGARGGGASGEAPRVVHFNLDGIVAEKAGSDPFQDAFDPVTPLMDLIERIDRAGADASVKEIVLTWNNMTLGLAQAEEIRGAILRAKAAGKPVRAHLAGEAMTVGINTYAMLSAAGSISMEPRSDLWLNGIRGEQVYLKTLLGKIGVEGDILHMGDYKSAGEMITNTGPSPEADAMMNWLFDGLYDNLLTMIAENRGMEVDEVRRLIDRGPFTAEQALSERLIDKVQFFDQFVDGLAVAHGHNVTIDNDYAAPDETSLRLDGSPFAFFQMLSELSRPSKAPTRQTIGVIYVNGSIAAGHGQADPFGQGGVAYGGEIRHWLLEAARNPAIKAVVLRVDSPGGSALGSEQIWRGTQEVRKIKPVVVSMGNLAASGGYYCSCGAQSIFADRGTLTASIGVVGGKFVTAGLWEKLGIDWVPYDRGARAGMFGGESRFSDGDRDWFEMWMETVYKRFQERVTEGRGEKLTKPMEELAGGRVFTGEQARELGLIDEIGGLHEAVAHAAKLAGVTDYEARVVPEPKDFLTQLIEEFSGQGERTTDLEVSLGRLAGAVEAGGLPSMAGAEAVPGTAADVRAGLAVESLMPVLAALDPDRTAALNRALRNLQLMRREGVALVMPFEMTVR